MAYFSEHYKAIKLPKSNGENNKGLRNAQIGAIHAIGQYFTLYETEPALIVMPTGSGKTAVLTLAPFLLDSKKALIISSSKLVGGQIFEDIQSLKTLKKIGVFDNNLENPKALEVKAQVLTNDDWKVFNDFDVVVGLPNSLSAGFKNGINPPENLFDLILVDEAHHKPADSWTSVVSKFTHAKKIFFTATPFRRDKKEIKGRLIYSYPLSRAFKDGIFGEIGYAAVNAEGLSQAEKDVLIAKKTEQIFQDDKASGLDHFLMVRTRRKTHADELAVLYKEETNLNLKVVHSSHSFSHIKSVIKKLKNKELDGIICVNMLGEGFDFPNLKIGAIHEHHKSLAVTLQFIGRFARTNAPNIGKAKFIAAETDIAIGQNQLLYQDGAIWSEIIFNLSEEAVAEVQENQSLNQRFENQIEEEDSDYSQIALNSICPYSHLKIFRTKEFNIAGDLEIPNQKVIYHKISEDDNAVIIITEETLKPRWMRVDELRNVNFFLYVLYYDSNRHLLYVHSSGEKSESFYEELISFFDVENFTVIHKEDLHKSLYGLKNINFFNIGLLNRAIHSGESYKMIAGSAAHNGIKASDGRMYSNGHVQGTGETNEGEKITIGYSSGSKVWGSSYLEIRQFIAFCQFIGGRIASDVKVITNTGLDSIPIPKAINQIPGDERVYFVNWHYDTFKLDPHTFFSINGKTIYEGKLLSLDLEVDYNHYSPDEIRFYIKGEEFEISFSYSFKDGFNCLLLEDNQLYIHVGDGELIDLVKYLKNHPVSFQLTDFSTITNGFELLGKNNILPYLADDENFEVISWDDYDTDMTSEFMENKDYLEHKKHSTKKHIHDVLFEILSKKNPQILIYDHGTGEIADFIVMNEKHRVIHIEIFHVKSADTDDTGDRVSYLYEVCGQAQKSLIWTINKEVFTKKLFDRLKLKDDKIMIDGKDDKIKKGDLNVLKNMLNSEKILKFDIVIVQPGLSQNKLSEKLSHLLAATDDYIRSNANNEMFKVIGSKD